MTKQNGYLENLVVSQKSRNPDKCLLNIYEHSELD